MRIGLLAISGWLVAAVMTIAVSWSAIGVVRNSVIPQTAVASAALPAPEETVSSTTRPSPTPAVAPARSLSGQGGSVTARCTGGVPSIVRIIPQQGFAAEKDDSGREVKFTSAGHETEIHIACTGSTASLTKEEKAISASGGDDNGGDDGGGSGRGRGGRGGGDDD